MSNAPGKGYFALGKAFAGCSTRQRASGKKLVGKDFFAGCFLSGTRQRLYRVQTRHRQRKVVVTAPAPSSLALPGAMSEAPGKDFFNFFFKFSLPGAVPGGTRQRFFYFIFIISLPGVAPRGHPAKSFLFFFVISLPGARSWGTRQRIFFF